MKIVTLFPDGKLGPRKDKPEPEDKHLTALQVNASAIVSALYWLEQDKPGMAEIILGDALRHATKVLGVDDDAEQSTCPGA